ncbi:MAG: hypothetical protein ACYCYA_13905, partial [Actinomycetes bacterium]
EPGRRAPELPEAPPGTGGVTPIREFRCPDDLWARAAARAHRQGITLSQVLRDALTAYVG